MIVFHNHKEYIDYAFGREDEFEKDIISNSKMFFGETSILIDAKKKIETKTLGASIPDAFLFDLSDIENPEFYLVEVELSIHSFFDHIFPQITKFFGFFKNTANQTELVEKIFSIINNDAELRKEFKRYLGEREIYKFLKDTIENSQNILLILDGEKPELPEITETYSDTWGKAVRQIIIRKFVNGSDAIFLIHPEFESIKYVDFETEVKKESEKREYTEEYHLDGVSDDVKKIYAQLKERLLTFDNSVIFNPQKYYISVVKDRNVAFFKIRKKKITLVAMLPEEEVGSMFHHHTVKHLSDSVQRFYNGPSCAVVIENESHLDEISFLLQVLVTK